MTAIWYLDLDMLAPFDLHINVLRNVDEVLLKGVMEGDNLTLHWKYEVNWPCLDSYPVKFGVGHPQAKVQGLGEIARMFRENYYRNYCYFITICPFAFALT